ncbi:hypothetical protein TanjilG_19905 [Lupinus angustifolius]|uniref:SBP-type domain-containing protein n=1 Tax=Lupinus angustifolius TaxID=3871 RepID=A0A1J7IHT3_LUPAN|nr:PREDICTED: teosinte glume architecture 1-like [Lupinus angustifolius]OIW14489.1 hypothetical protein TanjilG_19905 [Lupinus angustifolius]
MEWDWKEFTWDSSMLQVDNNKKHEAASVNSKSVLSSQGSLKQWHNGSQNLCCLVDGCNFDLSDCRKYHKRHRVCEKHTKTPDVLVGGKQQRFCQQCSRFHALGEFDDVKRSCRKRLDGHNRRRRKPQPPSLFMAAEKFLYNYKGPMILQFGNPQTYNMWPATAKTGAESGYDDRRLLYRIDKHNKQEKEHFLWQENVPKASNCYEAKLGTSISQPNCGANAISTPASGKKCIGKLSSDNKLGSLDSSCVLYLLSTLKTQNSDLRMVQSSTTYPIQSPFGSVNLDAIDEYLCSERAIGKPISPVFVLDANIADLRCDSMLQMGPGGLVKNEDSLTLPSFWE